MSHRHPVLSPWCKRVRKNVLDGIIILTLFLVIGCTKEESPETQITKMFQQSVTSANKKDLGGLMENVSEKFIGPYTMSKKDAKRYIVAQLYRKQWHRVFLYEAKIDVRSDNEANADIRIAIARGDKIEALKDLTNKADYDAFQLKIDLVKEDSRWLVIKAQHQIIDRIN
ncbi:MAG: hypothetical protein VYC39_06045 [Myxococcota bacterium]|nr:hypothetical protein [Myxococcota bacterium]